MGRRGEGEGEDGVEVVTSDVVGAAGDCGRLAVQDVVVRGRLGRFACFGHWLGSKCRVDMVTLHIHIQILDSSCSQCIASLP